MPVVIESAGDHRFDLNHLRQEGAGELVEHALRKAEFAGQQWRLQVQKKVTCNAETRPLAVVGFKPWCCYVKIKPGDNDSAHFCTLLMPPGFRGEDVFRALKAVEDKIDRNWRFVAEKKGRPTNGAAATAAAPGLPAEVPEGASAPVDGQVPPGDERLDAAAWIKDPEKTRLTLLAVHEVSRRGPHPGQAEFAAAVAAEMGWKGAGASALGDVFASLSRRGYVSKRLDGARHVGYELSAQGRELIRDLLPPATPAPPTPPPVELAFDPAEMLQSLTTLAQEYSEATRKLRENRERRARLLAEVEALDAEARDLERRVNDPEVQSLLRRLARITQQPR